jgi:hypothetical protein
MLFIVNFSLLSVFKIAFCLCIGRIFFCAKHSPHYCHKQHKCTNVKEYLTESVLIPGSASFEILSQFCENPGHERCDYCTNSNKETLHGKAGGALFCRKHITYKCSKWFHTDIDGSIHNPEQPHRHP